MKTDGISFRVKRIYQKDLTSECWPVQVWGLHYCSGFGCEYERMCEYLATDECGGTRIRKMILTGKFPLSGLPDVHEQRGKHEKAEE